jgi:hypothetical protein
MKTEALFGFLPCCDFYTKYLSNWLSLEKYEAGLGIIMLLVWVLL